MKKIPFNISASAQSQTALIRITGTIGWDTDCELFRARIDAIAQQGITDAHLYLNGPGGSVFDAEEIVNIIKSAFTGKVTGEGGALVASAYTRIALICESFSMPENGSFMVHKPRGGSFGTANEIRSHLKLLEDKETQYFDIYTARATDKEEFEKQWKSGDWWMTAKEALKNGFIAEVKGKETITAETTALITACGCPPSKIPNINKKEKKDMDLKTMALAFGLPESATEAEINAAVEQAKKAQNELADLKAANELKEKADRAEKIKARLDKAQLVDKVITGETREYWKLLLESNFESGIKVLDALAPVKKINIIPGSSANASATYKGKTFEQLQDEDPEALAELENNDPEAFAALFNSSSYNKKK